MDIDYSQVGGGPQAGEGAGVIVVLGVLIWDDVGWSGYRGQGGG